MAPPVAWPDPARLLAAARALSYPRCAGSDGDRRAIAWLAAELGALGLEVATEEFSYDVRPAFRALRVLLLTDAALVGFAGWAAAGRPALALGALATALVPSLGLLAWSPWLERLYRGEGPTRTANVVARRPAAGLPRRTVVLVAHHDSKSQSLILPVRLGLTLGALAGTAAVAAAAAAAAAGGGSPAWGIAAGAAAGAALAALATLRNGNRSPGAVDNAGSVAILLELARALPAEAPPDVELVFLSPGAEEDHMVGAMRWLAAHAGELAGRPVQALNLDGAGAPGRPVVIVRYGLGRSFGRAVGGAVAAAARRLGIVPRRVGMPPGMGIDGLAFVHRGIECPSLSSGSLGRAVLAVHSAGDRPENLDAAMLATVARLARQTVRELIAGDATRTSRGARSRRAWRRRSPP